jgi:excinuclease UvrABC ATPase subunit
MMAGVATTCEECEGKRFEASVLEYHPGGRDISEVLAMSVTEAEEFFAPDPFVLTDFQRTTWPPGRPCWTR